MLHACIDRPVSIQVDAPGLTGWMGMRALLNRARSIKQLGLLHATAQSESQLRLNKQQLVAGQQAGPATMGLLSSHLKTLQPISSNIWTHA
jgi:hypothetical protein